MSNTDRVLRIMLARRKCVMNGSYYLYLHEEGGAGGSIKLHPGLVFD